ncbi:MAG: transporter substrate-binding domain-containing protein [Sulfurospirillum sp.]
MKNLFLILLFFSISLASPTTIKVGIYENPPLTFTDSKTQKTKGLFIDILKNISKEKSLKLNFTHCKFAECLKLLIDGKIDLLGPIAYSPKRAKQMLFLDENILSNWGVVYVKDGSELRNFTLLRDKKIALLKNDIYIKPFIKMAKEFKTNIKVVYFDTYTDIFKALRDGKVFAGVGGRLLEYSMYSKFPSIEESSIIFKPTDITFALKKKDMKLKKLLDSTIENYKIDNKSQYYKILNQYLSIKPTRPYLKFIIFTILFLITFSLILMYINKLLNSRVKKATKELLDSKNRIKKNLNDQLYLTGIIETVKDVNQILIEEINIKDKLNNICCRITENSLYSFCMITHIDKQAFINIIARSKCEHTKKNLNLFFKNKSVFEIPFLAEAYKEKKSSVRSIKNTKLFSNAISCGFSYSMSTPIFVDKQLSYIISVFINNPEGFKDREVALIKELSGDIGLLLTMEKLKRDKEKSYEQIIESLNKAVEARDPYTAGHDERVQRYSIGIAKNLNLDQNDIDILKKASLVHDIGKIKIPDAILLKPAKLTKIEYDIVKEHPKAAYNMLKDISFLKEEIKIILYHHEKYDGSGYPDGLKGEDIPLLSQILSIADTFDAMTTNRIYKQAKSKKIALEELESLRDIHFSAKIIDMAIKYFQDISLKDNIYQMPLNSLEEARFSYFFKDSSVDCYNKNFLRYLFIENRASIYNSAFTINLKDFTTYNHIFGWESGDEFLANFVKLLKHKFKTDKVFRVQGDDFIILVKNDPNISKTDILDNKLFNNKIITIGFQKISMKEIQDIEDMKEIIRKL